MEFGERGDEEGAEGVAEEVDCCDQRRERGGGDGEVAEDFGGGSGGYC